MSNESAFWQTKGIERKVFQMMQLKSVSTRLGVMALLLLFVVGCASIAHKQEESMNAYRAIIDSESKMPKEARDALYEKQLWYSHNAWQKQDSRQKLKSGQLEQEFLQCLQTAEAIEKGISEKMGGIDPIQIVHARASVEVCMVTKGNIGTDRSKLLICEADEYDVLPICLMARTEVLNYR